MLVDVVCDVVGCEYVGYVGGCGVVVGLGFINEQKSINFFYVLGLLCVFKWCVYMCFGAF